MTCLTGNHARLNTLVLLRNQLAIEIDHTNASLVQYNQVLTWLWNHGHEDECHALQQMYMQISPYNNERMETYEQAINCLVRQYEDAIAKEMSEAVAKQLAAEMAQATPIDPNVVNDLNYYSQQKIEDIVNSDNYTVQSFQDKREEVFSEKDRLAFVMKTIKETPGMDVEKIRELISSLDIEQTATTEPEEEKDDSHLSEGFAELKTEDIPLPDDLMLESIENSPLSETTEQTKLKKSQEDMLNMYSRRRTLLDAMADEIKGIKTQYKHKIDELNFQVKQLKTARDDELLGLNRLYNAAKIYPAHLWPDDDNIEKVLRENNLL